jgi:hypothetical protein
MAQRISRRELNHLISQSIPKPRNRFRRFDTGRRRASKFFADPLAGNDEDLTSGDESDDGDDTSVPSTSDTESMPLEMSGRWCTCMSNFHLISFSCRTQRVPKCAIHLRELACRLSHGSHVCHEGLYCLCLSPGCGSSGETVGLASHSSSARYPPRIRR